MHRIVIVATVLALAAAGCGNDTAADPADSTGAAGGGAQRIVSLSATATEILYAIGAGDQVIAVDNLSTYPAEAPVTDLQGFEPSVEAIAELEPDLVVLAFDPGDVIDGLDALGITTLLQPSALTIDEAFTHFEQLGAATGHVADAATEVARISTELDEIVAAQPDRDAPLTFFHEIDDTLYTATSSSFVGELYGLLGLVNIADEADDGSGFPQLTSEYVIDADPDLIFLGDAAYGESAETVANRPGWDTMGAVRAGHVIEIDADLASRWGPRMVDLVRAVSDAIAQVDATVDA